MQRCNFFLLFYFLLGTYLLYTYCPLFEYLTMFSDETAVCTNFCLSIGIGTFSYAFHAFP